MGRELKAVLRFFSHDMVCRVYFQIASFKMWSRAKKIFASKKEPPPEGSGSRLVVNWQILGGRDRDRLLVLDQDPDKAVAVLVQKPSSERRGLRHFQLFVDGSFDGHTHSPYAESIGLSVSRSTM